MKSECEAKQFCDLLKWKLVVELKASVSSFKRANCIPSESLVSVCIIESLLLTCIQGVWLNKIYFSDW